MVETSKTMTKVALVYGSLPSVEEIDQFQLVKDEYEFSVISSESIVGYLSETSTFKDLECISLPDHEENTTYLPGLEKILADYEVVIVKGRLGMFVYQTIKAKWKNNFKLISIVDNATAFPAEDIKTMRTIREELNQACDMFLVQSKSVRETLLLEGIDKKKIHNMVPYVKENTSDSPSKQKYLDELGLTKENYIISFVGQIEWEEGLLTLVHALKNLYSVDKVLANKVKILISGIGSISSEISDRLIKFGMDRHVIYVNPTREAFKAIYSITDALYVSSTDSRDRRDLDPYRLLHAFTNKIPLIASRSLLVEEFCGKHRFDFCVGSVSSLTKTIIKSCTAKSLRKDITTKNYGKLTSNYTKELASKSMQNFLGFVINIDNTISDVNIVTQVKEAEKLVENNQYLIAVDIINNIFKIPSLASHHKSNLLRLIGDCFIKLGDHNSAKNSYIQSLEIDNFNTKANIGLGTVALTLSNSERAVQHFQKAVSLSPNDEMANLGLGLAFQGMNEFVESTNWVIKSLEINPCNTAALFTLVQLADSDTSYKIAEDALIKYISNKPTDYNMMYSLAGVQFQLRKYKESLGNINTILNVNPTDTKALTLMNKISEAQKSKTTSVS